MPAPILLLLACRARTLAAPGLWLWLGLGLTLCVAAGGCAPLRPETAAVSTWVPSNHRDWDPNLAVMPYAEFRGDRVTVHNIRNTFYLSEEDYIVRHYNKSFDLDEVRTVDFIVVPFKDVPSLAHTMLSFGLENGEQIVASVEARLEKGETYSPLQGAMMQYELMYVLGDERDLILLRTEHRDVDVFVYPVRTEPEKVQQMLVDILERANRLREEPEFYDTFVNNCTTNIVQHVNHLFPGRILWDPRILLPGYSDRLAYELGLIQEDISFELARRKAHVNERAGRFAAAPDFSQRIRSR